MKALIAALLVVLCVLQYRLWFGEHGVQGYRQLADEARATREALARLDSRNRALAAEVADLKSGLEAIEERARADLGMIDDEETFYRFVREADVGEDAAVVRAVPSGRADDG